MNYIQKIKLITFFIITAAPSNALCMENTTNERDLVIIAAGGAVGLAFLTTGYCLYRTAKLEEKVKDLKASNAILQETIISFSKYNKTVDNELHNAHKLINENTKEIRSLKKENQALSTATERNAKNIAALDEELSGLRPYYTPRGSNWTSSSSSND